MVSVQYIKFSLKKHLAAKTNIYLKRNANKYIFQKSWRKVREMVGERDAVGIRPHELASINIILSYQRN